MAHGIEPRVAAGLRLDRERFGIYARELVETAVLLLAVLTLAIPLARRWRKAEALILLFVVGDLLLFSRHRAIQTASIRPLTEQSAVLGKLSRLPTGSRTIDGLRNLPMVAGVAPLSAYRTLDRPALIGLVAMAGEPLDGSVDRASIREAMRAIGASVRVLDPLEPPGGVGEAVDDRALASWLYGDWGLHVPTFRVWTTDGEATRALFLPGDVSEATTTGEILATLRRGKPLRVESRSPEKMEVAGIATGPGFVILSVLDDPEWQVMDFGSATTEPIHRVFATANGGAWQAVRIRSEGPIRLEWTYRGTSARTGLKLSAIAWAAWIAAMCLAWWRGREGRGDADRGRTSRLSPADAGRYDPRTRFS